MLRPGRTAGSLKLMPPEAGDGAFGEAVDLWALEGIFPVTIAAETGKVFLNALPLAMPSMDCFFRTGIELCARETFLAVSRAAVAATAILGELISGLGTFGTGVASPCEVKCCNSGCGLLRCSVGTVLGSLFRMAASRRSEIVRSGLGTL